MDLIKYRTAGFFAPRAKTSGFFIMALKKQEVK